MKRMAFVVLTSLLLTSCLQKKYQEEGTRAYERLNVGVRSFIISYYSGEDGAKDVKVYEFTGDIIGHLGWQPVSDTNTISQVIDQANETRPYPTSQQPGYPFSTPKRAAALLQPASGKFVNHMFSFTGGQINRFNPATGSVDLTKRVTCTDPTENGVAFNVSPDGTIAAVATWAQSTKKVCLTLLDASNYTVLHHVVLPNIPLNYTGSVEITSDDKLAYLITDQKSGGYVYQIDVSTGNILNTITVTSVADRPNRFVMTPDGTTLFAYARDGRLLSFARVDTATMTSTDYNLNISPNDPYYFWHSVAMHPDGSRMYAVTTQGGPVFVISTADGSILKKTADVGGDPQTGPQYVLPAYRGNPQFTPDGRLLFFMSSQTWISVMDTATDTLQTSNIPAPGHTNYFGDNSVGFFFIPKAPGS